MKSKLCLITMLGLVTCSVTAFAQDNPSPTEPAPASSDSVSKDSSAPTPPATAPDDAAAKPAPADAAPAPSGDSAAAAPAATPAAEAPAPTTTPVAAEQPQANLVAANNPPPAQAGTAPVTPPSATNAPANAVIPLIVMDDVPLTDAIKNLARQAGLNYMLDPKIGFGQPGADGKPVAQPNVSIRWENITAEQALNALLNNYSLQLVDDPKTKIARVTVRDPAAPDPLVTRIVQLHYANPSNIVTSVQAALTDKRSKVVADIRTSQLVVLATEREQDEIVVMVERLDTITRQVLIEARLLETSMSPSSSKGIDWSGTLQAQKLAFGNNLQQNPPVASVNNTLSETFPKMLIDTAKGFNPATAFLDADGLNAVFSFLNANSEAKVISSPRTVTLDNESAKIEVTRASPIINITPGTVQVSGGSQITYTNLGIILNVTPRISANNFVNLKVVPEVSRIFDTITKVVNDGVFQVDEYDIRKLETRVMIPSGNTLVLGGLVQDDVRDKTTKVPILGDIPFLGHAFRSEGKSRQKSNLIIFITPTIVRDEDFQPSNSQYLHSPAPSTDNLDSDWSAWDSTKPKHWGKQAPVNNDSTSTQSSTNGPVFADLNVKK